MAPAQSLYGADEESSSKIAVKPAAEKPNGNLTCENNYEDDDFYAEPSCDQRKVDDPEDQDVDVLECEGGGTAELGRAEDPDATELSSSFGGTFSGSADGSKLDASDTEVISGFSAENGDPSFLNGFSRVFKKKRVTDHWRRFIHPIMWRCQWLELRMKELHTQALIYDKELALYKDEKLLHSKLVELDNSASRSVPLTCRSHGKQAMRRRKRKRSESTVDISSYMSNHTIFSYYENKRSETDIQSVDDDCDDQVDENVNDDLEWSVFRFMRGDSSLEQILLGIESALSRVLKLKSNLNEVMGRNAMEISSTPSNFFPGDIPTSCAQSPSFSPGNDGDAIMVGALNTPTHHLSDYEIEEMVMPESAVSSYGDAADVDMIETSMGLFSATDIPLDQHEIGELCRDADDDVLINNQAAEEERKNFEKLSHVIEKLQEMAKEEARSSSSSEEASTAPTVSMPEPSSEREKVDMLHQPVQKPCYTGKKRGRKPKKRRRGGLAAGSGEGKNERVQKRRLA